MSHTMKLCERVVEQRLSKETRVTNNQFCLCLGGRLWKRSIYFNV